jgi:glycerol-3-phosphate O-acyltransferase
VIATVEMLELLEMPIEPSLRRCIEGQRPDGAAALLIVSGQVKRRSSPRDDYLEIAASDRAALDYYRASITPALVWPGVIALALDGPLDEVQLKERTDAWLELLELEYFPVHSRARSERIAQVVAHQLQRGWLGRDAADRLSTTAEGERWMAYWRAQLRPVLEAYRALVDVVLAAEGRGTRKELIDSGQAAHREQLALGEALHPEGVCPVACGNALDWLVACGFLELDQESPESQIIPGRRHEELRELERRLSSALDR